MGQVVLVLFCCIYTHCTATWCTAAFQSFYPMQTPHPPATSLIPVPVITPPPPTPIFTSPRPPLHTCAPPLYYPRVCFVALPLCMLRIDVVSPYCRFCRRLTLPADAARATLRNDMVAATLPGPFQRSLCGEGAVYLPTFSSSSATMFISLWGHFLLSSTLVVCGVGGGGDEQFRRVLYSDVTNYSEPMCYSLFSYLLPLPTTSISSHFFAACTFSA